MSLDGGRRVAYVRWLDAHKHGDGPIDRETFEIGLTRETVGWVLRNDGEGIVLAMDDAGEQGHEYGFGIPRAYVREIRFLNFLDTVQGEVVTG